MKNPALAAVLSLFLLSSCFPNEWGDYYYDSAYKPILMERNALENSIKLVDPQTINEFGKIYRYQNLLFINERFEGVHVIDNTDPSNPVNIGFITIPGNVDIAIKNDFIYADNAVDLIVISYDQAGQKVQVVDRNRDVFPELPAPDGYPSSDLNNRPENTVIVKWKEKWKSI